MIRGARVVAGVVVLGLAVHPGTALGQGSRANGYTYSAWQATRWSALQFRTRCEGGPSGMDGGPIKWTVEFRNQSKEPVTFDYAIFGPGPASRQTTAGHASLKSGRAMATLAVVQTNRCDDGVLTKLEHVRFGADGDSVPPVGPGRGP